MNIKKVLGLIASSTLILNCSGNTQSNDIIPKPEIATSQNRDEINKYFLNLSDWSEVVPLKPDNKALLKTTRQTDVTTDSKGVISPVNCEVNNYSLTKTPEKIIMNNPAGGVLYPGALIQGEGYVQGPGGLRELPIRKRAPLKVVVDLANVNNAVTMNQVDYSGYQQAYAQLIQNVTESKVTLPAFISYKQIEAQEINEAALNLGLSLKYIGIHAQGDLNTKSDSQTKTYLAVFEQKAFTMSVVAPSEPAGFFLNDFGIDELKQQESLGNISSRNLPLYVSSVTYGRMLIFSIKTKASKSDIQGAIRASYKNLAVNVIGEIKAKYIKIMNEATIDVIAIGGDEENAKSLIRNLNLDDYFSTISKVDSFVPMSYVLRNIKDNSIVQISETTKYSTKTCAASQAKSYNVRVTIEKIMMNQVGSIAFGDVYGSLSLGGRTIWNRSRDQYISTKKNTVLETSITDNVIDFELPALSYKPISLKASFKDNNGIYPDTHIAEFNEFIGYDNNFRVRQNGNYQTDSQRNVTISYKIEILNTNY